MAQLRVVEVGKRIWGGAVEYKTELQAAGVLFVRQNAMLGAVFKPRAAEARRDEEGVQVRFAENKGTKGPKKSAGTPAQSLAKRHGPLSSEGKHTEAPRWTPWARVVNGRISNGFLLEFELAVTTEEGMPKAHTFRVQLEAEFNVWVDLTFRSTFAAMLDAQRPPAGKAAEDADQVVLSFTRLPSPSSAAGSQSTQYRF
uniref:Uncharacterized protein n=1 Tax=Calcidiscus leptoporus TaxID=127549 RepID=A0A7S0IVA7_9EUKA|mmetsp:Transcript_24715/g.57561  ORF Transcript_24715/g.57561 Transcript_24715/m.57561 type:complete len:199 (+) Transcript_24715:290-886(+)